MTPQARETLVKVQKLIQRSLDEDGDEELLDAEET